MSSSCAASRARPTKRSRIACVPACGALALLLAAGSAQAQPEDLSLTGVVSGSGMLTDDQREWLGFDQIALGGRLEAAYTAFDPLHLEARVGGLLFLSSGSPGGLAELGLGVALRFGGPSWLRWGASTHVNLAWTGPLILPSFDVGLRAQIVLSDAFALGPEVGFGQVFWKDGEPEQIATSDAQFWTAGLALTLSFPEEEPPEPPQERVRRVVETRVLRAPAAPVRDQPSPELLALVDQAVPRTHREEHLIPPVLFEHDSVALSPCGEASLYRVLELLRELRGTVLIEGHADRSGDEAYNEELSERRAEFVRGWLIARGLDAELLEVVALGEGEPLSGEATAEEERQPIDRRVTFRVVSARAEPGIGAVRDGGEGGGQGDREARRLPGSDSAAAAAPQEQP